jgi:lysophospholipase L1-like esterase
MKPTVCCRLVRLLCSVGLLAVVLAQCGKSENPNSPSPGGPEVRYTAIAASDGIGFGGSAVCVPFTECPNGTGYVQTLLRRLQAAGRTVTLLNLSVPGSVLSPASETLQRQLGRDTSLTGNFIERQAPFVPTDTTHVTVFAGGNDANAIGDAVRRGMAGGDIRGFIDNHVRQWANDLDELVTRVRARAPNARLVALNLPNLGGAPYVSGLTVNERSILQYIAVSLTDRINALANRNVAVVDLMCDARVIQPSSFSADGFHPNDAGYALMAELTLPALSGTGGSTPSASCATRTLLPPF